MGWYALFVETGSEELVQKWLRYLFDDSALYSVIPKRRLIERRAQQTYQVYKNMFPGYILIKTEMDVSIYYQLKAIPKLIRVLNNGDGFSSIEQDEISTILALIDEKGIVEYSRVLIAGSEVSVLSGPLRGKEGIIKEVNKRKGRAKISLKFNGQERLVDVGVEILTKV